MAWTLGKHISSVVAPVVLNTALASGRLQLASGDSMVGDDPLAGGFPLSRVGFMATERRRAGVLQGE